MMESTFGIPLDRPVTVNQDLTGKQKRYIQIRMEQLKEERDPKAQVQTASRRQDYPIA